MVKVSRKSIPRSPVAQGGVPQNKIVRVAPNLTGIGPEGFGAATPSDAELEATYGMKSATGALGL